MKRTCGLILLGALAFVTIANPAFAAEPFTKLVGTVRVEPVRSGGPIEVPYITWGGDVATFYANGGLTTQSSSIYGKMGLNLKLTPGDDFVGQVRNYMSGKTPFLRGTMRMIGQASEVIGSDPRTKPVVFLQLTWSAGDHIVSRAHLKQITDLKGKKVVLQKGGPHVGMLDDALRAAQLTWNDIQVIWADDLTGDKGPAAMFRKDPGIDACCVISPDMIGLTGGLDSAGSGAEGTIKGARVLVSTAQMSRSIADVYVVRKDYFDANRDTVEKLMAGYLKACEQVVEWRTAFDKGVSSPAYMNLLKMSQSIFGKDVLPTLEIDAHGLLLDCTYVGLPGNKAFFDDKGNLNGFESKQRAALDLAVGQGYAKIRTGFFGPHWDFDNIAKLGGLQHTTGSTGGRIVAEGVNLFPDQAVDDKTLLSFTINFEPNQGEFSEAVYGAEFQRAIQTASTFGNAVIAIRGHSDPTKTLVDLIRAGMAKGIIKRSGSSGNYTYYFEQKPLDLTDTKKITELIEAGKFDGVSASNPRETMQAALNLSHARAQAVCDAIVAYAKSKGFNLDPTQIQPVGVGVREPLIAKPTNLEQAKQNMRVEFRLVKVPAEAVKPSDFDF